jgi:hypothetical protein
MLLAFFVSFSRGTLSAGPVVGNTAVCVLQVAGLKKADHSPSVLLLDEMHERLSGMDSVPQEQADSIKENLQQLGRADDNMPNSDAAGQQQPDRIKYT